MNFSLNEDQREIRDSIIRFARQDLNGRIAEDEKAGNFPWQKWRRCADMGLMSLQAPEEYGGSGADLLTFLVSLEALSYACKDSGLVHAVATQNCCALQVSLFGSSHQKETYLSGIVKGEKVAAQAITEPDAGSDILAMRTKALRTNGGFVLNGTKMFISNGPVADVVIVFAVTNPERPGFGRISCLIVESGTEGLYRGKPLEKMGLKTLQNGELIFEDCFLPQEKLLGKQGQGMIIFNEVIEYERIILSAAHLGTMERLLELCVGYVRNRTQFGKAIGKFQSVSNKIADMKANIELGRLILYKSAWLKGQKKRATLETSIGKLFISESLKKACLEAIQIHGGYGYMAEFEIERDLRDSIASTIYSGTSEMQRNIIASLAGI